VVQAVPEVTFEPAAVGMHALSPSLEKPGLETALVVPALTEAQTTLPLHEPIDKLAVVC